MLLVNVKFLQIGNLSIILMMEKKKSISNIPGSMKFERMLSAVVCRRGRL